MKPLPLTAYWTCQIIGWSAITLTTAVIPVLYGGLRWAVVARALLGGLLGMFLTDQLRRHLRRSGWLELPLRAVLPRIAAASVAIAAAIVLAWSAIYLGFHWLSSVRAAERERWRLEVAVRDTELRALRAQLNPHFLFNSLNSLRGLVTEDPARAQEAITSLAGLLRYTLRVSRASVTTLEQELEVAQRYLELEALRFEARLRYSIDVEPAALEHPVPPMLVQTVVENAIKHGIAQLPEGGSVRIAARRRTDDLHIRVTNTGTLGHDRGESSAEGIGLANAVERLRLMFGSGIRLDLRESAPDEVCCDIVVPSAPRRVRHRAPIADAIPDRLEAR